MIIPLRRAKRAIKAVLKFEVEEFFKLESASSIVLLSVAMLALIISNIESLNAYYNQFLTIPIGIHISEFLQLSKPVYLWINDGLMAIFFLVVGLELKRELLEGHLSTRSQAMLPVIAAIGGMLVPAAIYIAFNFGSDHHTLKGWAIPSATDIAFSLGILTLLGNRVPSSLKVFLMALAIIDDLGAIIIIAIFYSGGHPLDISYFWFVGMVMIGLMLLNFLRVNNVLGYLFLGLFLWFFVLKSGIHATLAGVILAAFIPLKTKDVENNTLDSKRANSPLLRLEETLHPWVAYAVMPIFAFANAGVPFSGMTTEMLFSSVSLGIIAGLLVGKVVGVLTFTWLAIKLNLAKFPLSSTWSMMVGIGFLCGMGFTMSLFIGSLAFTESTMIYQVRFGVLFGSFCAGIIGYFVLRQALK